MSEATTGLLFGLIGGVLAWVATMLVGQPLYTFLTLRGAAAKLLLMYEHGGEKASISAWLIERENAYRVLGAEMAGFAVTHSQFVNLLRWRGFNPLEAGVNLMALASMSPGDPVRAPTYQNIIDPLRITHWIM